MSTHNICFMEKYGKLSPNYHQKPSLSDSLFDGRRLRALNVREHYNSVIGLPCVQGN